jgi:GNAT superfamily N-acetyltransferase
MASGGAGAPPPSAAPSIIATVSCGSVVAHEFFLSLFPYQKPFSAGQTPLGVLTDPDVFYYDESSPHAEETYDSFFIRFSSSDSEPLGTLDVAIKKRPDPHFHLSFINVEPSFQRKGLGKKCMAILEDIARRKGIKRISLSAVPERVSYYLGLNAPYTIAGNNKEGSKRLKFNKAIALTFAERKTAGNTNEAATTAARSAAGESLLGEDGEPLVEMTKTLPRKTRRNRRPRDSSRKQASARSFQRRRRRSTYKRGGQ